MTAQNKDVQKTENSNVQKTELMDERPVFTPLTDIYEKEGTIWVVCDMPGVSESEVDISLEEDVLTVCAHQQNESQDKYELVHQGYRTGIYRRSFSIGTHVDREKIKAALKKGVLTIELPKAEEAKPRKIVVNG